ncbi:transcription antitermination factor NusB [Exilibacterium tricleocarpae]|uniref:Transcription antitermination protein NusB n=1 Tax=Exilibacterium tricleocarpae TaxID=2591008 RepID=A0A545SQ12_9GAMM|nr:transcription antitermination factor NusB [Exilibacterium tricleocarpae]TQV66956.1 transcription antitermination factor NusB [Exilibacterium tricleocarpae]
MTTVSTSARRKARHYAMQAIYQWQISQAALNVIEAEFHTDNDMSKVDTDYFHELLHGIVQHLGDIDGAFAPFLQQRSLEELDPITRALLRLGTFELQHRLDVPYKVVINEAVALAKKFGATDSHKFINGVLDKTSATTRAVERRADKSS